LIEGAADLQEVLRLDESLWVATSAPTAVFRADLEFLTLVDTDRDGRIHTDELKAAIRWLLDRLADVSRLPEGLGELPLSAIRSDTPEGEALINSAAYVLESLGASQQSISLDQVRRFEASVQSLPLNGDGVLVPEAAAEPDLKAFIEEVIASLGGTADVSGKAGVTEEQVQQFMAAVSDYLAWREQGQVPSQQASTPLMPLGPRTPQAYSLLCAHADKVDLFFAQCRLVGFEPGASQRIGDRQAELAALDISSSQAVGSFLVQAPLAQPTPNGVLPLCGEALNPAYREWVAALREQVLQPVLGSVGETLSEAQWESAKQFLSPYASYMAAKKGAQVQAVPVERLLAYRDGRLAECAQALIEADREVAQVMEGVARVEQLLLYHQGLMRLVNNFVSFPQLYDPDERALFEMGSLVIDGRWFNLAVQAQDVAAHKQTASQGCFFTMYLEVTGAEAAKKFHVAVPVTSGRRGNLAVGKRGVFFDIEGREYIARVVDIIEQPISLQEALATPFVRIGRSLAGRIESLAGAAEKRLEAGVERVTTAAAVPAPAQAPTAASRAGMLMGAGVAIAAISSALAFIVKTLTTMSPLQIVLGAVGIVLAVMVPLSIVAVIKLRRRDLSALLEGCGWAINARMRLTRAQGRSFCVRKDYPRGAKGAPPPAWIKTVLAIVLLIELLVVAVLGARMLSACLAWRSAARQAPVAPLQKAQPPAAKP